VYCRTELVWGAVICPPDRGDGFSTQAWDSPTQLCMGSERVTRHSLGETFASLDRNLDELAAVDSNFKEIWNTVNGDTSVPQKTKDAVKSKVEKASAFASEHLDFINERVSRIKNKKSLSLKRRLRIYKK